MQSINPQLDPGPILQTAFGFWSSKVLLTAVEFDVFTKLGNRRMTGAELGAELGLHSRGISDFFDALVAMQFLDRAGDGASAKKFKTLCDVGGATGLLCIEVARAHPHVQCVSFDLPPVEPIARKHIAAAGLSDRVCTASGDFFKDPLPKADMITMGMILHDWNLEKKLHLIRAAYDALPAGGALVAIEALIDDARRENVFGLLMSLNMLIEFGDPLPYSGADSRNCG